MNRILTTSCVALIAVILRVEALDSSQDSSGIEERTSGPWTYTAKEKSEVTIAGYNGNDPNVVFPKEIDGKPVRTIGKVNKNIYPFTNNAIKKVTLPDGAVTIRNNAFINCRNLREFNIPSTVKFIESGAFVQTGVKQVSIPASVITMGPPCPIESGYADFPDLLADAGADNCFHSSTNLTSINVEPSNQFFASKDGVLFKKDMKTLVAYPSGKRGPYAIPNTVTNVGGDAFNGASFLSRVTIPSSVKEISVTAFAGCSALKDLEIPKGVAKIAQGAFAYCTDLQKVIISGTVEIIESGAFMDCVKLKKAVIEGSKAVVESDAFPPTCKVERR